MQVGWSVMITGPAAVAADPAEIRRLERLPLAPWDPAPKPYFVRIRASEMTGRRLPLRAAGVSVERMRSETD